MNRDGDGDRPAHDLTHNENSGSPMPQHRELHEDNLNRGVDVHPVNVNGSRGRTLDTANRKIHEAGCHCRHCQDTTCPCCRQMVRVSNPSEETSRAPGVMGLSVRENGRERSHSTTPSHLCPECSARVSPGAQLQAGRQEDGEASPRVRIYRCTPTLRHRSLSWVASRRSLRSLPTDVFEPYLPWSSSFLLLFTVPCNCFNLALVMSGESVPFLFHSFSYIPDCFLESYHCTLYNITNQC